MTVSYTIAGMPEVTVSFVPEMEEHLPGGVRYSAFGEVAGDVLLLQAPGVGRCRIARGRTVEFCPAVGAGMADVDHFLQRNVLLALTHQRGDLPLHGSSVVSPGNGCVLLFCGPSGAGKSTLAATFLQRGWGFFADDMIRISANDDRVLAWPGPPSLRLLPDACERLVGLAGERHRAERSFDGKAAVPVTAADKPAQPALIVLLGGAQPAPESERLSGAALVAALVSNIPGQGKFHAVGQMRRQLGILERLTQNCVTVRLHGRATATAEQLASFLIDSLEETLSRQPAAKPLQA